MEYAERIEITFKSGETIPTAKGNGTTTRLPETL